MQKTVCASRNCRMDQDRVFKAFHCHDIAWAHMFCLRQFYGLSSRFSCIGKKIRTCCRHQRTSRKCQSQCFCHDLHGRCRSDERTCSTARAGIAFRPVQFRLIDLTALIFCAVHSKLFQCQHLRSCIHGSARNYNRRNIHSCQSDEISRHSFITTGKIDSRIKRCGIGMDLDHICDHLTACQTVIDPVCSLAFSVTDICAEIAGSETTGFCHSFSDFFHQYVQMTASRMAVSISTLNHNLRFSKIFFFPSGPDS